MKSDLNKGIIDITYNDLNLPLQICYTGNNRIVYSYDAAGNKRKQEVYDEFHGKKPTTTTFIGNFVYQNGVLMWHNFDEGRVVYNKGLSVSRTEIFLKDHLGNVRVVYDNSTGEPVQHTNFYPFGMQMYTPSTLSATIKINEYLYNGKMYQDELGLGWYDYGARFYDGVVGRWWSVDPLAEKYKKWSPYNYCVDNPMRFVDPDGRQSKPPTEKKAIGQAAYVNSYSTSVTNLEQEYNKLPNDSKRTINGLWNVVSGGAQFLGGAGVAIGSGASLTSLGAIISMHGGYKVAEGVHQIANVITGTDSSEDPNYSTPIGSITEDKAVDAATDIIVSGNPLGPNIFSTAVNTISLGISTSNLSEALKDTPDNKTSTQNKTIGKESNQEKNTHHNVNRSFYQPY